MKYQTNQKPSAGKPEFLINKILDIIMYLNLGLLQQILSQLFSFLNMLEVLLSSVKALRISGKAQIQMVWEQLNCSSVLYPQLLHQLVVTDWLTEADKRIENDFHKNYLNCHTTYQVNWQVGNQSFFVIFRANISCPLLKRVMCVFNLLIYLSIIS